LTAKQALNHPWMRMYQDDLDDYTPNLEFKSSSLSLESQTSYDNVNVTSDEDDGEID
jgi:hypothetical protein